MAINPVRNQPITQIAVNPNGASTGRSAQHGSAIERPTNREAMKVELSPAARKAGAESAIASANRQSASSSDYFASRDGQNALSLLAPVRARPVVAV